ncbi:PhoH family protein [Candidatus Spongiihabitans sp.]|uniref:PhoH family protein n=1 Tax=Candidatus Spongiihabitans sp. TaxID=3101308 RepID=UPI003C6F52B2
MSKPITFQLLPVENERLSDLCGPLNCHLKQIENYLEVKIIQRSNKFCINGAKFKAERAAAVVKTLFALTEQNNQSLTTRDVHLVLSHKNNVTNNIAKNTEQGGVGSVKTVKTDYIDADDEVVIRLRKNRISGQNERQRTYLKNIRDNDISFSIGPAGTGKTYLAVACAVHALAENAVERILLVRPAVEAGEKLGFLPGDIGQKIDPYLRPIFDALYEMLGFDRVGKLIARGTIELAPLAYMRGRTLNESFVILDEAQNSTVEQMKMFLTRIGFGSKAIITGDITQVDLPKGQLSGLKHSQQVLCDIKGISFTHFKPQDVVRHPLVQRIVEAYEKNAQ